MHSCKLHSLASCHLAYISLNTRRPPILCRFFYMSGQCVFHHPGIQIANNKRYYLSTQTLSCKLASIVCTVLPGTLCPLIVVGNGQWILCQCPRWAATKCHLLTPWWWTHSTILMTNRPSFAPSLSYLLGV